MDVYVFGAGASVKYGCPTMRDLLPEAFSHWFVIPREQCHFERELGRVAEAIDQFYGANLAQAKSGEYPSAESAVKLHEANVELLFSIARQNGNTELERSLEIVVFNSLDDRNRLRFDRRDGEYERLIAKLIGSSQAACFISFNYDAFVDRALAGICQQRDIPWSYCVPFDAGIDVHFPSYKRLTTGLAKIKLLKLHGSFNWRQCEHCEALRLYYLLSTRFRPTWPPCERCAGKSFKPVLIAPAPSKNLPKPLEAAWQTAEACLKDAEALTIVGYSFPDIDIRSRDLFAETLENCRTINIVNKTEATRRRVRDLLSSNADSTIEEFDSFENYLEGKQLKKAESASEEDQGPFCPLRNIAVSR